MKNHRTPRYSALLSLLLLLVSTLFVLPAPRLLALEPYSVTIHRLESQAPVSAFSAATEDVAAATPNVAVVGAQFKLWLLDRDAQDQAPLKLAQTLDPLDESKLDALYGPALVSGATDTKGETTVAPLSEGRWYGREIARTNVETLAVPFVFDLPFEGRKHIDIYPKASFVSNLGGSARLFKYRADAGTKTPLAGVGFELDRVDENGVRHPALFDEEGFFVKQPTEEQLAGRDPLVKPLLRSDEAGEIHVYDLPLGDYEWRETEPLPGYIKPAQAQPFRIADWSEISVEIENHLQTPLGGKHFLKTEKNALNKPLADARFKLTQEQSVAGKKYDQTIQKDGQDYIVVSGADGRFAVTGLPYGRYSLWEIKAPEGYELLESALSFDISEHSLDDGTVLIIENKPTTRGGLVIPKTGDLTVFLMFSSGAILILIGAWIYRSQKAK